jgi:hypothetical protein
MTTKDEQEHEDTAGTNRQCHGRRHRRKERVLHTRISDELSEDIRRFAEDLRVPASNLVRNVLEEVFSVVETVSDNMGDLFEDLLEEAEGARERMHHQKERYDERRSRRERHRGRRRRPERSTTSEKDIEDELQSDERAESGGREPKEFPEVLGWQPLVLNREQACADCGVLLQKGDRAFLGVKPGGISDLALCAKCVRGGGRS